MTWAAPSFAIGLARMPVRAGANVGFSPTCRLLHLSLLLTGYPTLRLVTEQTALDLPQRFAMTTATHLHLGLSLYTSTTVTTNLHLVARSQHFHMLRIMICHCPTYRSYHALLSSHQISTIGLFPSTRSGYSAGTISFGFPFLSTLSSLGSNPPCPHAAHSAVGPPT